MYFAILALLMVVLPVVSVVVEAAGPGAPVIVLIGKWFVFYAVGLRLLLAGLKQVSDPAFTAREILGLKGDEPLVVVRELGFANLSLGVLGVSTLFLPGWTTAAALAGGIFYALAGVNHLRQRQRNARENVALATDLWAAAVLVAYLGYLNQ